MVAPAVGSEALVEPRSMCNHSALTDQFLASIHSAPRPATQPALVVLVVDDAKSGTPEEPQPACKQLSVSVVLIRPQTAPPLP